MHMLPFEARTYFISSNSEGRGPHESTRMNCDEFTESGVRHAEGKGRTTTLNPHFGWAERHLSLLRVATTAGFTAKWRVHLTREARVPKHLRYLQARAQSKFSARNARRAYESGGTRQTIYQDPNGAEVRSRCGHQTNPSRHGLIVTVTKQGEGTRWGESAL